jgi:ABC-type Fe3+-siderophore transport system permease subunit
LLAARAARAVLGEDPRWFLPGAASAGAGLLAGLDGLAQAAAWPGELPVGALTTALAGVLLVRAVVPR